MRCIHSNVVNWPIPSLSRLTSITFLILTILILQACQKHKDPDLKAVDMELIAEEFVSPIQVLATHNSDRLYVIDQIGKIWVIDGS